MTPLIRHRSLLSRIGVRLRAAATYDTFPQFSAKVRRLLYNPLGVLILAALAALLCGLFLHPQGLVLCGGIVTVIVLGVLWPTMNLRGLHGSVSFERTRAREGESLEVTLTLRNRLPWPAWGLAVRDGFSDPVGDSSASPPVVSIAAAPGRRVAHCRWLFVPFCRGVYPLVAPRLATGFPFGLWENKRSLTVAVPLLVWPRTFPVGPVPLDSGERQVEGNVARNKVGSSGDVLGVRPYRRGDSPRRIHWAQSAKHDRLIVCELQTNIRPVVQLVLDSDPRSHAGHGPDGSREWAIRIVASFARGWLEAGAQVGGVWNGQSIAASSGQAQICRLLDSLARLPQTPGPTLTETLANAACRSCDGLQIVVTTDIALSRADLRHSTGDQRRWVLLGAGAFTRGTERQARGEVHAAAERAVCFGQGSAAWARSIRPWLWIDSPERIPELLRGGWKEAQHGS